jgi:hypothetical protein
LSKTKPGIEVIVLGMVTDDRLEQNRNTDTLITVTVLGITKDVNPEQA